jgi:hypothetical protein
MPDLSDIAEVLRQYQDIRAVNNTDSPGQARFHDLSTSQNSWTPKTGLPQSVTPIETGFSGALVWRVDKFALRRWHSGMSYYRLIGIHQLLSSIHASGLTQIPKPIVNQSGESIICDAQNCLWQLEPWMPGQASFLEDSNERRRRTAFQTLARWHQAASQFARTSQGHFGFSEQTCEAIRIRHEMIKSHVSWLGQIEAGLARDSHERFQQLGNQIVNSFRRLHARIAADLYAARTLTVPTFPVIRDLWHDHLLFEADELTGLIDFGAVRPESAACDLSRLCGSLFADNQNEFTKAIDDYQSVRQLTLDELKLIKPLDHSGVLLSGMTWLERRYVKPQPIKNIDGVCDRLSKNVDRLNGL